MVSLRDELVFALQADEAAHIRPRPDMNELRASKLAIDDIKRRIIGADPTFDFSGLMPSP